MVAEVEKVARRHKAVPKGSSLPKIDLLTRAQARNLYVVRQVGAQEVADKTGLSLRQVYALAQREGWTKTRLVIKEKSRQALQEREAEDIDEMVEAVAIKSKVLTLGTLDNAIDELQNGGEFQAKNLQALSVAAKNFNGLYREAKRLDVQESASGTTQINMLFCSALPESAKRIAKDVTPSAAPASADTSNTAEVKGEASSQVIDVATTQGA